jgi:hypothetical protein
MDDQDFDPDLDPIGSGESRVISEVFGIPYDLPISMERKLKHDIYTCNAYRIWWALHSRVTFGKFNSNSWWGKRLARDYAKAETQMSQIAFEIIEQLS